MVNHPNRSKQQQAQPINPYIEGFKAGRKDGEEIRAELLAALKDVLGDKPGDLNDDYECVGCGRDYDFSELKRDACCPAEDCPRHNARAAIAKVEGR